MNIYFNENSLLDSSIDKNMLIISLSRAFFILKTIFDKYCFCGILDNVQDEKYNGHKIIDIIKCCSDKEAKSILLLNISNYRKISPPLPSDENYISISLHTNDNYKKNKVTINSVSMNNVPCFETGTIQDIIDRSEFLKNYISYNCTIKEPISSKFSNIFYNNYFHELFVNFIRQSSDSKRSTITSISSIILEYSNFIKNTDLCKKNQGRHIYSKDGSDYILSTDFRHGTFEIFDTKGRHLREINYHGEKTKDPDSSGKHNIKI